MQRPICEQQRKKGKSEYWISIDFVVGGASKYMNSDFNKKKKKVVGCEVAQKMKRNEIMNECLGP